MSASLPPVDAVLLLSFGGPEGPADVLPFLENVTRGRGVPRERLEQVAAHYLAFGGRSPINGECRRLLGALSAALAARGVDLPLYWGNRNWSPFLADTVAAMQRDGVRRAVAVATSAYSSFSACRQYLGDIDRARAAVGPGAPLVEKLAPYWNAPGFLETMIEHAREAIAALPATGDAPVRLVFTAHSIPLAMARTCAYEAELAEAASIVAGGALPGGAWDLVYQSRSGAPGQPWLEPDVCDHLRTLAAAGTRRVVLVPIGFVADHMEVVYDLDTEARAVADELGLEMTRARAAGAAPRFAAALAELVVAHMEGRVPAVLGTRGARPMPCAPGCCDYVAAARPGAA